MATRTVQLKIIGDASKLKRTFAETEQRAGRFGSTIDKVGRKFGGFGTNALKMGAGIAAAFSVHKIVDFLGDSVEAAQEAKRAQLLLQNTLKNSPKLVGESADAFNDLAAKLQGLTTVDDEAVVAVEALLGQFGLTKQQILEVTPLVVDVSRKMNVDLPTAAKAVGKAIAGSNGSLSKMGIVLAEAKDKGDRFKTVIDGLRQAAGGFAEQEGATLEGKLARIKNQFGELKEKVGNALLPILEDLADLGLKAVAWMQTPEAAKLAKQLKEDLGPAAQIVLDIFKALGPIVPPLIKAVAAGIGIWGRMLSDFKKLAERIINGVIRGINATIGAYNLLPGHKNIKSIPPVNFTPAPAQVGNQTVIGGATSFDHGGIVPGPLGVPRLATVHGGEEVLTPAQRRARETVPRIERGAETGAIERLIAAIEGHQRPIEIRIDGEIVARIMSRIIGEQAARVLRTS